MASFATEVDDPFAHNVFHAWEANWGRAVSWNANDAPARPPANGPPTRQANDAPAWQANDAPASQSDVLALQQQFPLSQIFAQAINHLYMGHALPNVADPNLGPPKAAPAGPPAGPPDPVPVVSFPVRQYPEGPPVAFPYPVPDQQLDSAPQAVPCVPPLPASVQPEPQAGPPVLFDDVYLNTPEFSTLAPEVQLFLKSLKKQ
jgi:hypothetical protein